LQPSGDRFAQLHAPFRGGVLGIPLVDGLDRRLLDEIGRVEIGLTGAERDDILSFPLQSGQSAVQGHRLRFLHLYHALG